MLQHNKKRNVGLLNEFFARDIAKNIIEKNYESVDLTKKIYKNSFSKNSELLKENFIFNTLYTTNVKTKEGAQNLLNQAKNYCKQINFEKLEKEKTKIIIEVNKTLNGEHFFSKQIPDFRTQATIQVLLNSWINEHCDNKIKFDLIKLEEVLIEHLITKKEFNLNENLVEMKDDEIDAFVVKLMIEKFNEKYSVSLNENQRKIISYYVFCENLTIKEELVQLLENVKQKSFSLIEKEISQNLQMEDKMKKKLIGVKNLLLTEYKNFDKIDENTISFYMQLTELQKGLETK